uniref:Uncharacterized protein n=1 Tax=Ditylenchus dipsaci TaxID=166011 RepID=A0A915CSA5_9BILA
MLAADALGNAFYELGLLESFFAALIVQKYYLLWQCFCMQALPMFGAMFTTTSMLFIAIDRLLSITFPILPVLCTLGECYQPQLGAFVGRNGTVIQLTTITLYLLLGAIIKFAYKKRTSAAYVFTRQIYKSLLFIVMFLCFNLVFNLFALQMLPGLQLSKISTLHVSLVLAYLPNIAGATHALVLYTFSHEYRKAFKVYVHCSILERTSTVHLYNRDSIFSSTKF